MTNQPEHEAQVTFFDWIKLNIQYSKNKELKKALSLCYSVPNGAPMTDSQRVWMTREGMTAGMPDINLDWPAINKNARPGMSTIRDLVPGLRIEMKHCKNKPTAKQLEKHKLLEEAGYKVAVCYLAQEAIETVFDYLPFEKKDYQGIEFLK